LKTSTGTGLMPDSVSVCASRRAVVSQPPPGLAGAMIWIALLGKPPAVGASAAPAAASAGAAAASSAGASVAAASSAGAGAAAGMAVQPASTAPITSKVNNAIKGSVRNRRMRTSCDEWGCEQVRLLIHRLIICGHNYSTAVNRKRKLAKSMGGG